MLQLHAGGLRGVSYMRQRGSCHVAVTCWRVEGC